MLLKLLVLFSACHYNISLLLTSRSCLSSIKFNLSLLNKLRSLRKIIVLKNMVFRDLVLLCYFWDDCAEIGFLGGLIIALMTFVKIYLFLIGFAYENMRLCCERCVLCISIPLFWLKHRRRCRFGLKFSWLGGSLRHPNWCNWPFLIEWYFCCLSISFFGRFSKLNSWYFICVA